LFSDLLFRNKDSEGSANPCISSLQLTREAAQRKTL
jgi:hypothetical protein